MDKDMTGLTMKYFVLKPAGDSPYHKASREAMKTYAALIEDENLELAHDLRMWAIDEQGEANRRDLSKRLESGELDGLRDG